MVENEGCVCKKASRPGMVATTIGGADHGEANDATVRFEALEAWARNLMPRIGKETHRWSGQVLETIDYAAFIGRNPGSRNVYVHTGDSGQGITHGAVGALLNSALILGEVPQWANVYDPGRKTPLAVGNFLRENVTAIKNFAEYLAPGEIASFDELKPGCGAIVRQGLSKVAAYRDQSNALYRRSAACTHIGCHLHWNAFESCWDCPCHGSPVRCRRNAAQRTRRNCASRNEAGGRMNDWRSQRLRAEADQTSPGTNPPRHT